MKFLTYTEQRDTNQKFGFKIQNHIINVNLAAKWVNEDQNDKTFLSIPGDLKSAIAEWDKFFPLLQELEKTISNGHLNSLVQNESELVILPPIPDPPAFRDFYA